MQIFTLVVKKLKLKSCCVNIFVKISRLSLSIFFIKLWFLSFIELAIHDIARSQPGLYITSYLLAIAVTVIYTIEMLRAYSIVAKALS